MKNKRYGQEEKRSNHIFYPEQVHEEERPYYVDRQKSGMELVQVAILICIAVAVGLIFKEKIVLFVDSTFDGLLGGGF